MFLNRPYMMLPHVPTRFTPRVLFTYRMLLLKKLHLVAGLRLVFLPNHSGATLLVFKTMAGWPLTATVNVISRFLVNTFGNKQNILLRAGSKKRLRSH